MENEKMLYTKGNIGSLQLKNRWIMLAMHTGYARDDGSFSERDFAFYCERARGGMSAITLVGAVNEEGEQESMHRLDGYRFQCGIREVCDIIHEQDCKVIMQLFHAGRNKRITQLQEIQPVCPSAVPSLIYKTIPREMTQFDISRTINDFANAAVRCKACGIDAVEVSLSAGYLLSQFLSSLVNHRTDQWGGTPEKRMAFPTEVLINIRKAVGEGYPVLIKISGGDMLGGYDLQFMADFINQLPKGTIDGVTVTGGWHEAPVPQMTYHVAPGGFSYLAGEIRRKTGLPVIACNRINSEETAETILRSGEADFVGAARPFLTDPQFVNKMQKGIPYLPCQACNKGCIERILKGKDVQCAFNPDVGREFIKKSSSAVGKKILIVGAGPAGLLAAKYASADKNYVIVITKDSKICGRLSVASKPPHKQELIKFTESLAYDVRKLGAIILTDTPVSEKIIDKLDVDEIYFATGSKPVIPFILGMDQNRDLNVYTADDVLNGECKALGNNIVIVGGGSVGLETAEYIAAHRMAQEQGSITVVEIAEKAGKDLGGLKWIMMKTLKEKDVKIITSTKIISTCEKGVIIQGHGEQQTICADSIIFAVGGQPNGACGMEAFLDERRIHYHIVGDALKPGDVRAALKNVYETYYEFDKK